MKKITIIKMICLGTLALTQMSCEKTLNALPDQAKVAGNAIVDQKSAEAALNGVYYQFANVSDHYTTGLPSTDWSYIHELAPSEMAGHIVYYQGAFERANNTLKASQTVVYWRAYYNIINAANGVISGVESLNTKIDPIRKAEILGEAHFLRAYGHWALLSYFGEFYDINSEYGVMLREELVTVSNIAKQRNTVQESYQSILEDVDFAIEHAPITNVNYYSSQWAARALKMRILINRGIDDDYNQVINLANEIIDGSPYELEPHVRDIFTTKGLESKEIILGTKAFANQISELEDYWYRDNAQYFATETLQDLLEGDPRKDWMYDVVEGDATFTKYLVGKSEAKYAFRLTEVYLLKAEAILRSGGSITEARPMLKEIMSHAGVTDYSEVDAATSRETLLVEVYKEIARNLVAEDGADWFALLRLPFETVKQIKPTIVNKTQYIMPVPLTEHEKNPTFGDQNPGYGW